MQHQAAYLKYHHLIFATANLSSNELSENEL